MNSIDKRPREGLGYGFVDPRYLPEGKDEYYLRDLQARDRPARRGLTPSEIAALKGNQNSADDWSAIEVGERFDPDLVRRCMFHGRVRIGNLEKSYLEFHDLRLPVGLYDSTIVSCDIGSDVVIDNVRYLAHYVIGNEVILLSIDEMLTTDHSKFGSGIVKEGESEEVRVWLEVGNENGGRRILAFDGMLPADAYLWSKHRDNARLMARFKEMTDSTMDPRRGYYGTVGDRTIVKHCGILKDVKIGSDAYIKGANKLKNLTINSDREAGTQIGEGVELVNGIVGYGCKIFYGVKAVRFLMGSNSALKYGARLINSVLGDNSTISCCEVLNSLIFPGHEQHHNNSFLCAATVLGQSNIAAGATIGSNHNSRGSDGELWAGRGFWPALCVSLKHNSRFASFTLLAKGSYPAELDVRTPFSLVSHDERSGRIRVMPAYWFMYNMYALERNAWKYAVRDRRPRKELALEFGYLAPDTVEEIFTGMELIERWTGRALLARDGGGGGELAAGRKLLREAPSLAGELSIYAEGVDGTGNPAEILKAGEAYAAYREMVAFYGVSTLVGLALAERLPAGGLAGRFPSEARSRWASLGGQLVRESDLRELVERAADGRFASWEEMHEAYRALAEAYPARKGAHAMASLLEVTGLPVLTRESWHSLLDRAERTMRKIVSLTRESREKDFRNPFRRASYDSPAEMEAVIGTLEHDAFIERIESDAQVFSRKLAEARSLG